MNFSSPFDNAIPHFPMDAASATDLAGHRVGPADPAASVVATAPNSKPREYDGNRPTYVYQDRARAEPSRLGGSGGPCHETVPPKKMQCQKLPNKLAAMLSDPTLTSAITWMPHGRSWKILDRELFASLALPRYFGHSNHSSFVRLVNAWGFRRITKGTDHDSYYHELFLRGKPRLHERMKRMPACHLKTPVDKEAQCPDFYALAKTSPLPEVVWNYSGTSDALAPKDKQLSAMSGGHVSTGYPAGNLDATSALLGNKLGNADTIFGSSSLGNARSFQPDALVSSGLNSAAASLMDQFGYLSNSGSAALPNASFNFNQLAPAAGFNQPAMTAPSYFGGTSLNQGINDFPRAPVDERISLNDRIQLEAIQHTNELLAQNIKAMQRDAMAMKQAEGDVPSNAGQVPPNAGQFQLYNT